MNINTNIQSFSSQSGIKVTQNGNSNQSIDKNKNSEAVNINIDSKTLDTLNLLSSLGEETILKAYDNSYINKDGEAITKRLNEHYKKQMKKIKGFQTLQSIFGINIIIQIINIMQNKWIKSKEILPTIKR